MNFLEPITLDAVAAIVWPLCRIAAFLGTMFAVSSTSFPNFPKSLLALAITVCMLPNIPSVPTQIPMLSPHGMVITLQETLIGAAMGLSTLFISQAFVVSGQAIAMQTGLGFASLVDPVSGNNAPVVGQFFTVLVTLLFFALDGHLYFLRLVLESFRIIPIGNFLPAAGLSELLYFGSNMFKVGLTMAMSAICTMLVVNFTLGVMTKAAPQLNVFSLGFAFTLIVGIIVLWMSLNAFMSNYSNNFNDVFEAACSLLGTSCSGPL